MEAELLEEGNFVNPGDCSSCVCDGAKLISPKGKMQSPLETTVQALRDTRLVEEVCAWTTVGARFPQMPFVPGSAAKRRRLSSTWDGMPALLAPRHTAGLPGQLGPQGVADRQISLGSSTHFWCALGCCVRHRHGCKQPRRRSKHRHRKK